LCSIVGLIGAAGCTRTNADRDAGGHVTDMGTPAVDVGHDAPTTACTADPQCNDSIGCTIDQCIVGNVCQNMPINSMCNVAGGEHCEPGVGCTTMTTTTCNSAAECDDHIFCNGAESCVLHECFHDPAGRNCDDGNACTIDSCDESAASCSYMTTCDSGVVTTDSGPTCTTFSSPADFNGTYALIPAQSQACTGGNYNVSEVTLTVTGSTVSVVTGTTGGITLSGTISGNAFTATGTHGSGTYSLSGTFTCRERFMGHWTATVTGFGCVNQDVDVRGSRR